MGRVLASIWLVLSAISVFPETFDRAKACRIRDESLVFPVVTKLKDCSGVARNGLGLNVKLRGTPLVTNSSFSLPALLFLLRHSFYTPQSWTTILSEC